MSRADQYHFSDFTRSNYRRLLKIAKDRYKFQGYLDDHQSACVIWRHDIDISPHAARRFARIETEEGIQATYFVLLHSEFYNALEREVVDCIREIRSLGHAIGLHFDPDFYDVKREAELETHLEFERTIAERLFETSISIFSFHKTTEFSMSCTAHSYAGLVNAYSNRFQEEFAYCSDSNGYWRFKRLEDVLSGPFEPRLQVLTHAELWQDEIMSPKQRVDRCIDGRAEKSRRFYDDLLRSTGRQNIDW